ncbi:MAG TPA: serine hydrolase domain-containing protein [Novosphingobium sp.]|nr:serine hydrolase domain-containing protein [Novosphingobium sp.]
MRRIMPALAALLLAACAAPSGPVGTVRLEAGNPVHAMNEAERERVRMAGPQMLFWPSDVRLARFREMERPFPGTVTGPARRVRPLPPGNAIARLPEAEVAAYMAAQNLVGLIVVQDGRVRLERYAQGFAPDQRWTSFSVAKSLTATLAGQALAEGRIRSLADPVTAYLPELKGSGYDGVTVEQVLTMSSGVRWNEDYADPASDVARMFSEPLRPGEDPALAYMARLPREAEPGAKWLYKTGETNLAGAIVQRATGMVLTDYAARKLVPAAGFEGELFWIVDPVGTSIGGCCLSLTLRDYARFGLLALEGGRGVTGRGWFAQASRAHHSTGAAGHGYGYQWWTYPGGMWGAQGIFGQAVTILPAKRAVIVQLGNWPRASDPVLRAEMIRFFAQVGEAL